jgi:ABC-type oligopeptide transport system substrate-binding subunit
LITSNKRWRLLAVLAVFALVIAACSPSTSDESTTTSEGGGEGSTTTAAPSETTTTEASMMGGTVHGPLGEAPAIDPQLVSDSEGFEVARLVFDGLTLYDPAGGAVIPGVAESWEANADNTVWTFHLHDGVTFHDGSPVTAQSFVDGFTRLADPDLASPVAYHGSLAGIVGWDEVNGSEPTGEVGDQPIEGVQAVDDLTFEVTLNSGLAFLPKIVAHPAFSPVNMDLVNADGWADMPIGNGPYMMREPWQHQVSISLDRYDGYYGTPGNPDSIEFTIFADLITAGWQAFLDGQLDVSTVAAENEDQAIEMFGELNEVPTGSFGYLGFPTQTAPYDNPDMRRALVMAVDREAIATRVLKTLVANGFVPPVATGSVDGLDSCAACNYDPAAAKELFDSLGGIPGNKVTISFNSGAGHEDWIEAVANDWTNNLGLEVEFNSLEWAAYLEFLGLTGGPPATEPFRLGWLWDYPSAYNFLAPLYLSTSGDNYTQYSNPDFDALMEEAAAAATEEEAIPALEEAQRILGDEVPVMPMTYGLTKWVKNDTVDNVSYNDFGFFLWENMTVTGG